MIEVERKQRWVEAMMHTMVTCGTLWAAFWLQFVISVLYNIPAIHTLSRGNWIAPPVEFYLPVSTDVSFSLAACFAGLSVFGSLLALVGVWHWTHTVRGKWRMRILVAGFAGFLSMWSLAALIAEDAAWQALEDRLVRIEREIVRDHDPDWRVFLEREKVWVERMLEMRPRRK